MPELLGTRISSALYEGMMGRSGYTEDYDGDPQDFAMWRGQVASAIRGKRGQAFLRDLIEALDAMPVKKLIANELERTDPHLADEGSVCAIGALGKRRRIDMEKLDPEDYDGIAAAFGIASPLVRELEWTNDDGEHRETPEKRWRRVRDWAAKQIKS